MIPGLTTHKMDFKYFIWFHACVFLAQTFSPVCVFRQNMRKNKTTKKRTPTLLSLFREVDVTWTCLPTFVQFDVGRLSQLKYHSHSYNQVPSHRRRHPEPTGQGRPPATSASHHHSRRRGTTLECFPVHVSNVSIFRVFISSKFLTKQRPLPYVTKQTT